MESSAYLKRIGQPLKKISKSFKNILRVSSSPFLLNATIKHHIEGYKEADPEADFVEKFPRSIYVDDLSSVAPWTNTGYELYLKAKLRLTEGEFNLRKFVSNCPEQTNRIQCNESRNSDAGTSSKAVEPKSVWSPRTLSRMESSF